MVSPTAEPCYNRVMATISIQEIQRDPASFLRRVEARETLIVIRDERSLAEIKPLPTRSCEPRPFGLCAGELNVSDDFDAPLPESVLLDFEG